MINTSNSGYVFIIYYLHIFLPLMHLYITCITYAVLVIVEYRTEYRTEYKTVRCGIHVRDTKLL